MAKPTTPISDIYERLMSTQMSTVDILATLRIAEANATTARAATPEERKRWADQKKRQRGMSTGQDSAAISCSELDLVNKGSKKERNSAESNVHVDKSRSKGTRIPDDWEPDQDDVGYGITKVALTLPEIESCAEEMVLWAKANANRAVARKADWSLTFKGWMRRNAPQIIRNRPRGPGGGGNAATSGADVRRSGFAGIAARIRHGAPDAEPGRPAPEDLQPVNRR